jgi:hypothetical protein
MPERKEICCSGRHLVDLFSKCGRGLVCLSHQHLDMGLFRSKLRIRDRGANEATREDR